MRSLGSDAELSDSDEAEIDDVRAFLDRHEMAFTGTFQKVVNAGKRLRYATSEQQVRSIPFFTFSGASDYWNPKVQEDVYIKAQIGRYRVRGYGGARAVPHLSDLAFQARSHERRHARGPGEGGRDAHRDRWPERGEGADAHDAGDDRADELRRTLALDQAGGGHGVEHGRHRREHR